MNCTTLLGLVAVLSLTLSGCQVAAPPTIPTAERPDGPPAVAPAVVHPSLADHPFKPKRLEAAIQVNMFEMYFANPEGQKNPTFRLPAGKTVGIHLHNEGAVVHEFAIGRGRTDAGGFREVLTEMVPMDVFFYYGEAKAEMEEATFGELEVDKGLRDIWLRAKFPEKFRGVWEIGCFVEGHYEAGMHATLTIE